MPSSYNPTGAGGTPQTPQWTYATGGGTPSAGQFTWDGDATINFDSTTKGGSDWSSVLGTIGSGTKFVITGGGIQLTGIVVSGGASLGFTTDDDFSALANSVTYSFSFAPSLANTVFYGSGTPGNIIVVNSTGGTDATDSGIPAQAVTIENALANSGITTFTQFLAIFGITPVDDGTYTPITSETFSGGIPTDVF